MFLDLIRWRFQKDKFALPSMCVCRRHIEREHAVILTTLPTAVSLATANSVGSRVFAKSLTTYRGFSLCRSSTQRALNICPPASSFSPLVDLQHSRCMNRLRTPQCSDVCIEFVCLFQIRSLCSSFENLLFDRSTPLSGFETVSSSVNDRRAGSLLLNLRRACSSVEIPSS